MGQLRVNGPVPGKRPILNPHTCSGYPRWNTFAPLGITTTTKDARSAMQGKVGSVARPPRRLDPRNLAHRADYHRDILRGWFNRARVLSLKIDHAKGGELDRLLYSYTRDVHALRDAGARGLLDQLIKKEAARGVVRCTITIRQ